MTDMAWIARQSLAGLSDAAGQEKDDKEEGMREV